MRGPRLRLFGLVLAGILAGAACGSDDTTSSTNAPPADTAAAVGTAAVGPDPAAPSTDAPPDGPAAVEAFWAEAIAACNEQSQRDLGAEAFDGSAADPTVGVTFDDEVSPGVYRIEDAAGVVLLVDVNNRVVTGPDGPDGIMSRNYIFVCPEAIFVGAFDEDGMMDDEGVAQLYLQSDGLGVVEFGSSPETTISLVSDALGPFDDGTGWIDSFSAWGTCPGPMIRVVRWWNLDVLFTDGDTEYGSSGEPHFFNWRAPDLDGVGAAFEFTTRAGIGLGSTVEQLRSVYGEDVVDYDPDFDYWHFNVASGADAGVSGSIEGSGAPSDPVRFIEAGALCGE